MIRNMIDNITAYVFHKFVSRCIKKNSSVIRGSKVEVGVDTGTGIIKTYINDDCYEYRMDTKYYNTVNIWIATILGDFTFWNNVEEAICGAAIANTLGNFKFWNDPKEAIDYITRKENENEI